MTCTPRNQERTPDGRWTVTPATMGAGTTGWAGGRGWSNGSRHWRVTDTAHRAVLAQYGDKHAQVFDALWRVRELIAAVHAREAAA